MAAAPQSLARLARLHAHLCSASAPCDDSLSSAALTVEDVRHFREHGWVACKGFWEPRELEAIRRGLGALQTAGRLANVATSGDGVTHTDVAQNLQLCPVSPELPIFRSLPFHPRVARAVSSLLCDDPASESVKCYLSQIFLKPARQGLGTSWHQDNAYFKLDDAVATRGTAMWTAVHDATVENGTIEMAGPRGRRFQGLPHRRDLTSDHHVTCADDVDDSQAVPVELPAGSVVFFAFNHPHCTRANRTAKVRAGLAYHFVNAAYCPSERQFPLPTDADWKTPVVSGPELTDGVKEYGFRAATWEKDVEETLALYIGGSSADGNKIAAPPRVVAQDRA